MSRILLNEGKAVLRMFAHQPLDEIAHPGAFLIFLGQSNAAHTAGLRVTGGFAELLRVHFAKALESINIHIIALEHRIFQDRKSTRLNSRHYFAHRMPTYL